MPPERGEARNSEEFEFEVALSFAGSSRPIAESLAELLGDHGIRVFYDDFESADLWGKDLYQHLELIYRDKARYCVVLISKDYLARPWPRHELRQAQARSLASHREYILPLRLDDTELPGLSATIGYVDLRQISLEGVANLLLEKLYGRRYDYFYNDQHPNWDGTLINFRGAELASYWPGRITAAQETPYYVVQRTLERIRYGDESSKTAGHSDVPCHDCGVVKGEFHVPSCDWEECPQCHNTALGCSCIVGYTKTPPEDQPDEQ